MIVRKRKLNPWFKRILLGIALLSIVSAGIIWYIFTEKFSDTTEVRETVTINALDLIHEFEKNDSLANKKYTEKIIVVNGVVSEVEPADSTVNLKIADTATGSYIIFAFQQQHQAEAKSIRKGDKVSIKGSCSGGAYSQILETEFITFKRCALNK
ncbi:MAG: hypothetical protein ABIN94_13945 [Ferruginibacter sp.]